MARPRSKGNPLAAGFALIFPENWRRRYILAEMAHTDSKAAAAETPPAKNPRHWLIVAGQILFFILIWLAADYVGRKLGGKIPGSVLGMMGVLLLLGWGMIEPKHIQQGAQVLLAEMLLFFVPAFVGLVNYSGLLGWQGLRLLAMIALGTIMVMVGTVWVVDRVFRWESRKNSVRRSQA